MTRRDLMNHLEWRLGEGVRHVWVDDLVYHEERND